MWCKNDDIKTGHKEGYAVKKMGCTGCALCYRKTIADHHKNKTFSSIKK
jgi:hypothetical protein